MQVIAFSNPGRPDWRWRIVGYSGDTVEESHEVFSTIANAVAQGARRLEQMNVSDRAAAVPAYRIPLRRSRPGSSPRR